MNYHLITNEEAPHKDEARIHHGPDHTEPSFLYDQRHILQSFPESSERGSRSLQFPLKLYDMLEAVERHHGLTGIVSWIDGGKAFRIHNPDEFITAVAPTFFDLTKYKSFKRQLLNYNFKPKSKYLPKESSNSKRATNHCNVYYHPQFRRGFRDDCWFIQRKAKMLLKPSPVVWSAVRSRRNSTSPGTCIKMDTPLSREQHFQDTTRRGDKEVVMPGGQSAEDELHRRDRLSSSTANSPVEAAFQKLTNKEDKSFNIKDTSSQAQMEQRSGGVPPSAEERAPKANCDEDDMMVLADEASRRLVVLKNPTTPPPLIRNISILKGRISTEMCRDIIDLFGARSPSSLLLRDEKSSSPPVLSQHQSRRGESKKTDHVHV